MEGERTRRARSFGGVADEYERGRPDYPAEVIRWLLGEARVVVDVGAGTGKLTRGVAALGCEVVAVEPLAEMASRLSDAVPSARVLVGSAEAIPLPDACADAVVAGQAFHWFDAALALPEIARVLRPGGALGLVWNVRDESVPWVARLSAAVGAEPWGTRWPAGVVDASGLFGPVQTATFRHEQLLDRAGLLDLVASRSNVAVLDERKRARVLEVVSRLFDEEAGTDELALPYLTHAFRARRP